MDRITRTRSRHSPRSRLRLPLVRLELRTEDVHLGGTLASPAAGLQAVSPAAPPLAPPADCPVAPGLFSPGAVYKVDLGAGVPGVPLGRFLGRPLPQSVRKGHQFQGKGLRVGGFLLLSLGPEPR